MNYLLDTHILLWSASDSPKLSSAARTLVDSSENTIWFSVLSLWEVALKRSKSRDDFIYEVTPLRVGCLANGYFELEISAKHIATLVDLPPYHTDPFDRLLIAQAKSEGFRLLTADRAMAQYQSPVLLV